MRASTSGNSPLGVVAPGARHAWGPSRPGSIMKGEEAPPCGDLLRAGSLRRRCGSGAAILRKHLEGSLLAQAVQQPVHRLLGRLLAQLVLQIEKRGDVVGAAVDQKNSTEKRRVRE